MSTPAAASELRRPAAPRARGIGPDGANARPMRCPGIDTVTIKRVRRDPTGHQDHRHARTGVCGPARQVKSLDVRAAIGRFESSQPTPVRCDPVDRAIQDAIAIVDIRRGQPALDANMVGDIGQTSRDSQLLENRLAVVGEQAIPVMMRAEVWHVDEHIQGLAFRRRDAGFGSSRGADVTRGIRSKFTSPVDGLEFLFRIVGEDKVVVQKLVVATVEPEVENDA